MPDSICIPVDDYRLPDGWLCPQEAARLTHSYCEKLESGSILLFRQLPFRFDPEDRKFLLAQNWTEARLHKNVSYRPQEDTLNGVSGAVEIVERMHSIMRSYSTGVLEFLGQFLSPYAGKWLLDFSSFRPLEEQGRNLSLHKRNDLLHVDAFPSRPTRGGRILRVFTNLNPSKSRVWETTGPFSTLAGRYAEKAGLSQIAHGDSFIRRSTKALGRKLGIREAHRTPYDRFMLRFHDFLKENSAFQSGADKERHEFPPFSTWLVYTDGVAHSALSGQFAMEQTLIIPPEALVAPDLAPYRILEQLAHRPLVA